MAFSVSIDQALALWSQLERAYYGVNSYGGDTAEIYLYTVMPYNPSVASNSKATGGGIIGEIVDDAYRGANEALHDLLEKFSRDREVLIKVEGRDLGPWLRTADFRHRVRVQVIQRLT